MLDCSELRRSGVAALRESFIARRSLVEEIRALHPALLSFVAPAGFGKTTIADRWLGTFACAARVDCSVADSADGFARATISAIAASDERVAERLGADVASASGIADAAVDILHAEWLAGSTGDSVCFFDNCETLVDRPAVLAVLAKLLETPTNRRCVVLGSRVELGVRTHLFAPLERTRFVSASDLRFARCDIDAAFDRRLSPEGLDYVETVTRGWPVVVMLWSGRARTFDAASLARDGEIFSAADLGGYLSREVIAFLEPATLDGLALCASCEATDDDLAMLDVERGRANAPIARSLADVPLVNRMRDGVWALHPVLKDVVLRARGVRGRELVLSVAERFARRDRTLRAAQLFARVGDERRAADTLTLDIGFLIAALPLDVATLIASFSAETLLEYPLLWNAATLGRAFLISQHQWREEAERVWARVDASTPFVVRAGCFSSFANVKLNLGDFAGVRAVCDSFVRETSEAERPVAAMVAAVWRSAAQIYAGRDVDLDAIEESIAPLLAIPSTKALWLYAASARRHRHRGDRAAERTVLAQSLDIAAACGLPLVSALCAMESAFSAWLYDDQASFAEARAILLALENRSCAKGISFFVACTEGDAGARTAYETYFDRTFGYLILAEALLRSEGRDAALAAARKGVEAADLTAQPFLGILARIVACELGPHLRLQFVADVLRMCADFVPGPVRDAFSAWADGRPREPGVVAFAVRRFGTRAETAVCVWLTCGLVTAGSSESGLTPREREIVCYLAAARRPVGSEAILEAIFGSESLAARNQLKVYISRIRKALGRGAISTFGFGYGLGPSVTIDVDWIGRALDGTSPVAEATLVDARDTIVRVGRGYVERWPWYVGFETQIVEREARLNEFLADRARAAGDVAAATRYLDYAAALRALGTE